ncbi:porin family protein [Mangrovivirga cuniculi]|uniref:Outer membrane protein beta-barrel domain-containing protein n=1 Tax=Mangrovivirga cuniculi TaxID=2715131 RepID=A0A4D7JVG4_9BACT|nr:porin family protein [Mangrovivirga cuniculi]QCK16542.1 hypothetical protein DCC35_18300 [Mangrovivirga cuniculi]
MKKLIILSIITLLGLSSKINAQDVSYGLKTGLNIANVIGGDADRNNLFTFHAGGFVEFGVNEKFSIQQEILFSRQGSEIDNSQEVRLDYLAFPILAKYYLTDYISIEAGPQISFLVEDKVVYNENGYPPSELDANSFDLGLNIGFGYNISSRLLAQMRYNYGITTISENPDSNNSVFQISVGYKFK